MLKLTSPHRSVRRAVLGLGALLAAAALAPAGASAQEGPDRDRAQRVTRPDSFPTPLVTRVRTSEGNSGHHTVAVPVHLNCGDTPNEKQLRTFCRYSLHVAPRSANEPSDYFAWWGFRGTTTTREWKVVDLKGGQAVNIALYVKVLGDTKVEADETFDVWIGRAFKSCVRSLRGFVCQNHAASRVVSRGGTIVNDDSA